MKKKFFKASVTVIAIFALNGCTNNVNSVPLNSNNLKTMSDYEFFRVDPGTKQAENIDKKFLWANKGSFSLPSGYSNAPLAEFVTTLKEKSALHRKFFDTCNLDTIIDKNNQLSVRFKVDYATTRDNTYDADSFEYVVFSCSAKSPKSRGGFLQSDLNTESHFNYNYDFNLSELEIIKPGEELKPKKYKHILFDKSKATAKLFKEVLQRDKKILKLINDEQSYNEKRDLK